MLYQALLSKTSASSKIASSAPDASKTPTKVATVTKPKDGTQGYDIPSPDPQPSSKGKITIPVSIVESSGGAVDVTHVPKIKKNRYAPDGHSKDLNGLVYFTIDDGTEIPISRLCVSIDQMTSEVKLNKVDTQAYNQSYKTTKGTEHKTTIKVQAYDALSTEQLMTLRDITQSKLKAIKRGGIYHMTIHGHTIDTTETMSVMVTRTDGPVYDTQGVLTYTIECEDYDPKIQDAIRKNLKPTWDLSYGYATGVKGPGKEKATRHTMMMPNGEVRVWADAEDGKTYNYKVYKSDKAAFADEGSFDAQTGANLAAGKPVS